MLNKRIIIGLIVLSFLICGVSSASLNDDSQNNDIYLEDFGNSIYNYSVGTKGNILESYEYSVDYKLGNASRSLIGSEIVTQLYDNNSLLSDSSNSQVCNSTEKIKEDMFFKDTLYNSVNFELKQLKNATHCVIMIIKDGKIVFNTTQPFNMDEYEDLDIDDEYSDSSSEKNVLSSSDSSNTYVASSNSNKFHSEYCSQAKKINDANKITFSSRDEAINAGYEPCEICYP